MLLREVRSESEAIHEVLIQEKGRERRIDLGNISEGDVAWLDLTQAREPDWSEINVELPPLRKEVREQNAYLVILLPDNSWDLHPELGQYRARIEQPAAGEVLRRYLLMDDIPWPDIMPRIAFLGEGRPLRDFSRYVNLIGEAKARASGGGSFADWCAAAYLALSDRAKEIEELVGAMGEGAQRALLLAVAMLHGAHADSIHQASSLLLQLTQHPPDSCPVLQRAAFGRRLRDIHASLGPSGRVTFTELGYDAAVRSYIWSNFPELHEHVVTWMEKVVNTIGLADDEREVLAQRFAELCLPERYRPTWVALVERWADQRKRSGAKAAIAVLRHGIEDEQHGRIFRRQIYEWSRNREPSPGRVEVIVAACRDYMAVTHPDEALVRLHHLSQHERGTQAREALLELAGQDRRFFRQLLSRVTDTSPDAGRWTADPGLFLHLAANLRALTESAERSPALIGDVAIRRHLESGWNLAFDSLPYGTWSASAEMWLDLVAEDRRHGSRLLDVLVSGAAHRTAVLGRLYMIARTRPAAVIIGDLLVKKSNAAQGIPTV